MTNDLYFCVLSGGMMTNNFQLGVLVCLLYSELICRLGCLPRFDSLDEAG